MREQFAYCKVAISPVRQFSSDTSEMVTQLLFGEVITVIKQEDKWWKIQNYFDNYVGWCDPKQLTLLTKKEVNRWLDGINFERSKTRLLNADQGVLPIFKGSLIPSGEVEDFNIGNTKYRFESAPEIYTNKGAYEIAMEYLNAPYLWGGRTPFGIDCSGLTQAVFRFLGINLPRDASQQVDSGRQVSFDEIISGDVAFFHNDDGKIVHVGILNEKKQIIHASGYVRINKFDTFGILSDSEKFYTHKLNSIKRMQ